MTGPTSTPRGERAGTPGAHWETRIVHNETVVDGLDTAGPDMNQPLPAQPNRATRRALARANRRKK